ncbi:glycosyltransferase family 88 protein [Legionella drancourtii]|uniref:glycosyltransferase family 88 protein n=1 Tax=Legionella drancourtii TaxID=168933 RepID=UPI0013051209|nr:glycosyltransferase family 88 protein [Legionella drancourtii]
MKVSCVKIWFSNNPDVFLPEKNQQRLRKLRESHPEHPIIFVVACKLLSENANQELIQFCEIVKNSHLSKLNGKNPKRCPQKFAPKIIDMPQSSTFQNQ